MDISILIPHYKTGKMTAYIVAQLLKYKGKHNIKILISDNNSGDGSIDYLMPFESEIKIVNYPKNVVQSHGVSLSRLVELVETDYFITIESDSFPTQENWIDYYKPMIEGGYDISGSIMSLSGGIYIHPCGALYKKESVLEAQKYCSETPYHYLPNSAMCQNFPNHLMVHNDIWDFFLQNPKSFVELPENCQNLTKDEWIEKERFYKPVVCAFHNGMGNLKETINDYGKRDFTTGINDVLIKGFDKTIFRMGYEPGQWLTYWMLANNKKVAQIPTEIKWMKNRENQQQEYTKMENGLYHIWGVSSYTERSADGVEDIYKEKRELPEKLYDTLPDNQKIRYITLNDL